MATVVQMKMQSKGSLSEISSRLRYTLVGFDEFELVCCHHRSHSTFLCFERYYRRTKSYATLSILLCDEKEVLSADLVGSGGGVGFLNRNYGVNEAIVFKAVKLLEEIGFRKIIE